MPSDELKDQVHVLAKLLIEEHVAVWYNVLTDDQELLESLTGLTETLYLQIAERCESVDWQPLLEDKLPREVLRFLEDHNTASDRRLANQTVEESFLELCDHPGRQDEQKYLTDIADGLLVLFLPIEDLSSGVAYSFVRELLADLVLKLLVQRLSAPWFLDTLVLEQTAKRGLQKRQLLERLAGYADPANLVEVLSSAVNAGLRQLGRWSHRLMSTNSQSDKHAKDDANGQSSLYDTVLYDIVEAAIRPSFGPLARGFLSSTALPGLDLLCGSKAVTLLRSELQSLATRASATKAARLLTDILFPNGKPSPPMIIPSIAQQAELRAAVEQLFTIPASRFTSEWRLELPFWSSKECNKVLLFRLLDLLLVELLPELGRRTPSELKSMRMRVRQADLEAQGVAGIGSSITPRLGSPGGTSPIIDARETLRRIDSAPRMPTAVAQAVESPQRRSLDLASVARTAARATAGLGRGRAAGGERSHLSPFTSAAPARALLATEDILDRGYHSADDRTSPSKLKAKQTTESGLGRSPSFKRAGLSSDAETVADTDLKPGTAINRSSSRVGRGLVNTARRTQQFSKSILMRGRSPTKDNPSPTPSRSASPMLR